MKYADVVQYGNCERSALVSMVVLRGEFLYFDDRADNIENVAAAFPLATCVHVKDPLILFRLVKFALSAAEACKNENTT